MDRGIRSSLQIVSDDFDKSEAPYDSQSWADRLHIYRLHALAPRVPPQMGQHHRHVVIAYM